MRCKIAFSGSGKTNTAIWMEQKDFSFFQSGFLQIYLEPPFPIGLEQLIYIFWQGLLFILAKNILIFHEQNI